MDVDDVDVVPVIRGQPDAVNPAVNDVGVDNVGEALGEVVGDENHSAAVVRGLRGGGEAPVAGEHAAEGRRVAERAVSLLECDHVVVPQQPAQEADFKPGFVRVRVNRVEQGLGVPGRRRYAEGHVEGPRSVNKFPLPPTGGVACNMYIIWNR